MLQTFATNEFFNLTSDAMIITKDGYFQKVNRAMCELLQYTEAELVARPYMDFIYPADRKMILDAIESGIGTISATVENRYVAKDGTVRWISWVATRNPHTGVGFAVGRDITQVKIESEDIEAKRLKIVNDSKIAALSNLAANIAHEINNPLTVIYGQACRLHQAAQKTSTMSSQEVLGIAQSLESMSLRIIRAIDNLSSFTRNHSKAPFLSTSLRLIIDECIFLCRARIEAEGIQLVFEKPPVDWTINCRPQHITHALLNVINNATEAVGSSQKKWIKIEFKQVEAHYEIIVSDSGPGLKPDVKQNLFTPFFTTKLVGQGMGLGLNISQNICREHGGELSFAGQDPHTTFVLHLPRTQAPRPESQT